MKKVQIFMVLILVIYCSGIFLIMPIQPAFSNKDAALSNPEKLRSQRQLEIEGKTLFRTGQYEEALHKFQEANDPKYWLYEGHGNGYAEAYIREIYVMREEFEKALANVTKILALDYMQEMLKVENEVSVHHLMEQKSEYESLIRARDTNSNKPIYDYIDYLKKIHAIELPPQGYDPIGSLSPISTILRLYDTIGDYDAGIALIDEILAYFRTGKAGDPKPGRVDAEYIKVREAFEAEKKAGGQAGEYCIGDATKALIESDYFPW